MGVICAISRGWLPLALLTFRNYSRFSRCALALGVLLAHLTSLGADSVVVFNEIMYHPPTNEPAFEWIELHNQMAVNVDLSGWHLAGGVDYQFPEGSVIPGNGYAVIAISPTTLAAATGLTNIHGPFTGRLSNSGETLELRNNNGRLMDQVTYGAEDDWPVGPDGAGVSLAKRNENSASAEPQNWTMSALAGGTPGQRNFPPNTFEVTNSTPVTVNGSWKYSAAGTDLGTGWRDSAFDDSAWASGAGLFQAGNVTAPTGDLQSIPTIFSSGVDANGTVLPPGSADPHFLLTQSAQSTPPPPAISATVIQNHPAWLANDVASSWIGPVNPGTTDIAAGNYNYRTSFDLSGYDLSTVTLTMNAAADNNLSDVSLNGISKGISYEGFSTFSGNFVVSNGFVAGSNTLDFAVVNYDVFPNPGGFRLKLNGSGRKSFVTQTPLPPGPSTYYFRKTFTLTGAPQLATLQLNATVADGAVFYLNGTEVLRLNLPAGPITASTPAISNVPSPAYLGPIAMPNSALLAGTNVLAVELHQAAGGTNDVLFGASLSIGQTNYLVPPPVTLAFNEMPNVTNQVFWIEIVNYGTESVSLGNYVLGRYGSQANEYIIPQQVIPPGGYAVLERATLGFGADPGDPVVLFTPGKASVVDALVAKRFPRARWPEATGAWLYPSQITPGAPNQFAFHNEIVINEIMYHPPPIPGSPAQFAQETLLPITASWRYNQTGANLGTNWYATGFNDQAWPFGAALLYNETATLPASKNTPLTLGATTYYFRTQFVFNGSTNGLALNLRTVLDDGAVFYLNGREVYRQNMTSGAFDCQTYTTTSIGDATYLGPFTLSATNLIVGTNILAVEVHQGSQNSSDIVFGAELAANYQTSAGVSAADSPESWLELYNRSTNAVDLTGWKLQKDIEFNFTPGTTIPADGYLVVAKDVSFMQSNYPAIAVTGPFTNKLAHSGGDIVLADDMKNSVDEVHYFDSKPWPEYADGGGSSLELRDPWADNSKAEVWAASVESERSGWSNYTFHATAANLLGPAQWNEFIMGLLDPGECLVDDLSVVESPSGSPVEMLQNGSFEMGLSAWRALGNHSRSRVEQEPGNPSNHVLHLISTGPTEHLHNHLETTYASGRTVTDGREYQISFRAKWIAGNNRLNTRLYFNRVAKTTALTMPTQHGTPGARNSTYTTNLGPTVLEFAHGPLIPQPAESVTVTTSASDPQNVTNVILCWAVNGGSWNSIPMSRGAASTAPGYTNFSAAIPGQAAGALVQFYVQAADALGAISTYPSGGTNSRALFKVSEGKALMTKLHRFQLLMTASDADLLHAPTNVMSDDMLGATILYDEQEVFYDIGLHLQSSERGRSDSSRVGFAARLNAGHYFRGVQNSFVIDRSGGYSGQGGRQDEILLWHAVNHAGNLLGLNCDLVQVFAPRAQEDSTGLLRMSAFDKNYFEGQFKNGGDGNLYKLELIYYPYTTVSGDAQSPKLPQPDDVINMEIQDWGDNQEDYRWIFLQENHADLDDYSQLIALGKAFSLAGSALEAQTSQLMDLDEWTRTLAFLELTGNGDIFTHGLNHNWEIYFRPGDGLALGLLWDMDYSFVQSTTGGFPGTGSPNTYKILTLPNNYRRYCNHLLDITTTTVNSTYLTPWATHYGGLLGENWSGTVNYLQQRANYLRSTMPLTTPFAIKNNNGNNFATSNDVIALTGTAPLTVKDIEINGVLRPVSWTSLTNWVVNVPLENPVNVVVAQGVDNYGVRPANATDSITVTNLGTPAPRPVVINEWMADNSAPGGFPDGVDSKFQDWFELFNPNNVPVNLSGYTLTDTLSEPTKWRIPTNTIIPAHGFLVVWADNQTNQNGLNADGDLHANFQLSNSGEEIGLYAPDGTPQHTITFGAQSQNVSEGLYPDGDTTSIHSMFNWTPRSANQLGTPPAPQLNGFKVFADGSFSFTIGGTINRTLRVEYKNDLSDPTWIPLSTNCISNGSSLTVSNIVVIPQRFYRAVLLP